MKVNIDPLIFNTTLKETMDCMGLQGYELAEAAGRSRPNISEIRQGKAFPSIKDFVEILMAAEQKSPGFFNEFARRLVSRISCLSISYDEKVDLERLIENSDSVELMEMLNLISNRLVERTKAEGDRLPVAS